MTLTDDELVARALEGAEDAYRGLGLRYERPVYNLIVRMVRDPALAEDLAQDVFVKAFARLTTFDRRFKFSSWIFTIAHHTVIDSVRRGRVPTLPLEEIENAREGLPDRRSGGPDEALDRADLAEAIDKALGVLRADYRQAIVLRYQEELSQEEIARIMDLPVGTVKTYLHRARAELARLLGEAGWGPEGTEDSGPRPHKSPRRAPNPSVTARPEGAES